MSPQMIERAKAHGHQAHWHVIDATGPVPKPQPTAGPSIVTIFRLLLNVPDDVRERAIAFAAEALPTRDVRPAGGAEPRQHALAAASARPASTRTIRGISELSDARVYEIFDQHGFTLVGRKGCAIFPRGWYRAEADASRSSAASTTLLCASRIFDRYAVDVLYVARRRLGGDTRCGGMSSLCPMRPSQSRWPSGGALDRWSPALLDQLHRRAKHIVKVTDRRRPTAAPRSAPGSDAAGSDRAGAAARDRRAARCLGQTGRRADAVEPGDRGVHAAEGDRAGKLDIVNTYRRLTESVPDIVGLRAHRGGATLMVSWATGDNRAITSGPPTRRSSRGPSVQVLPHPILLRMRWEMDRPNLRRPDVFRAPTSWRRGSTSGRSSRRSTCANVSWVWCPTIAGFANGTAPRSTRATRWSTGPASTSTLGHEAAAAVPTAATVSHAGRRRIRSRSSSASSASPTRTTARAELAWLAAAATEFRRQPADQSGLLLRFRSRRRAAARRASRCRRDRPELAAFTSMARTPYFNPRRLRIVPDGNGRGRLDSGRTRPDRGRRQQRRPRTAGRAAGSARRAGPARKPAGAAIPRRHGASTPARAACHRRRSRWPCHNPETRSLAVGYAIAAITRSCRGNPMPTRIRSGRAATISERIRSSAVGSPSNPYGGLIAPTTLSPGHFRRARRRIGRRRWWPASLALPRCRRVPGTALGGPMRRPGVAATGSSGSARSRYAFAEWRPVDAHACGSVCAGVATSASAQSPAPGCRRPVRRPGQTPNDRHVRARATATRSGRRRIPVVATAFRPAGSPRSPASRRHTISELSSSTSRVFGSRRICRRMSTLGVRIRPPWPRPRAARTCVTTRSSVHGSKETPPTITLFTGTSASVGHIVRYAYRTIERTSEERGPLVARVVFLGGLGRSGTTLLERMLGEVPGVCALGEVVHLWQRDVRDNESCGAENRSRIACSGAKSGSARSAAGTTSTWTRCCGCVTASSARVTSPPSRCPGSPGPA